MGGRGPCGAPLRPRPAAAGCIWNKPISAVRSLCYACAGTKSAATDRTMERRLKQRLARGIDRSIPAWNFMARPKCRSSRAVAISAWGTEQGGKVCPCHHRQGLTRRRQRTWCSQPTVPLWLAPPECEPMWAPSSRRMPPWWGRGAPWPAAAAADQVKIAGKCVFRERLSLSHHHVGSEVNKGLRTNVFRWRFIAKTAFAGPRWQT